MVKTDRNLTIGIIALIVLPILFFIFLKVTSSNLDNGEGMAFLAFMLFYAIFHGFLILALLVYDFVNYKKQEALQKQKSKVLLLGIFLSGFIPASIVYF